LEGGYSRLLEGAVLEAMLEQGPLREDLEISPFLWKKIRPVDLRFNLRSPARGTGPFGLHWSIAPQAGLRCRILFERNAYLGNFRVPSEHYAIQWDVDVVTESALRDRRSLASLSARSRVHFAWVEVFPRDVSGSEALTESWRGFKIPWDEREIVQLRETQVQVWSWSGQLRLALGIQWGFAEGWSLRVSNDWVGVRAALNLPSTLAASLDFSREGTFHLRWIHRSGKIQLNLDESRRKAVKGGFQAKVSLNPTAALTSTPWLRPGLRGVNASVRKALQLRAEISLAIESEKWRHHRRVLRAEWDKNSKSTSESRSNLPELRMILSGRLPPPREGFQISGRFENFRSRRFTLFVHLVDWLRAGYESEKSFYETLRVTPLGDLVLEREIVREERRHWWDRIQLLRLVYRQVVEAEDETEVLEWSLSHHDSFSHQQLKKILLSAARLGAIRQFGLPPAQRFPLRLTLVWMTQFEPIAVDAIRTMSTKKRWELIIRSLEISDPERYAAGRFWRDWIESDEVRRRIDLDPVGAHLSTKYPVPGRTSFQRRQIVADYLKAKTFLKILEKWEANDPDNEAHLLFQKLDYPAFIFCHLACPKEHRRSRLILQGEWEDSLGQPVVIPHAGE